MNERPRSGQAVILPRHREGGVKVSPMLFATSVLSYRGRSQTGRHQE